MTNQQIRTRHRTVELNKKYGPLTVLNIYTEKAADDVQSKHMAECKCDCGLVLNKIVQTIPVAKFCSKRCGLRPLTSQNNLLRSVWGAMKQRCYNLDCPQFSYYGQRGIIVCDKWRNNFRKFQSWALNNGYQRGLTLDRINNDGNYKSTNCRWVDYQTQSNNTRQNKILFAFNEYKTLANWYRDDRCAVDYCTLKGRIKNGWNPETALTKESEKPKIYSAFEEEKTLVDWGKDSRCVVRRRVLWERILKGWDFELALTTLLITVNLIEAFGESKSMTNWSKDGRCVVSLGTLKQRIYDRNWPAEKAIITPARDVSKK